ncbi:MAG: ATP synthase F1 subunit delta [Psychroflexus salarius]
MSRRAAKRYAKALVELSQENNNLDTIYKQMQQIFTTTTQNKELKAVLHSPVVSLSDKLAVVKEVFSFADKIVLDIFKVLCDNKRISLLSLVADEFIVHYKQLNNLQDAQVTTAVTMTKAVEEKVQAKIKAVTGNTATITNIIDQSLLGGFILRVNDLQFDASVQGNLNTLKRKLLN